MITFKHNKFRSHKYPQKYKKYTKSGHGIMVIYISSCVSTQTIRINGGKSKG